MREGALRILSGWKIQSFPGQIRIYGCLAQWNWYPPPNGHTTGVSSHRCTAVLRHQLYRGIKANHPWVHIRGIAEKFLEAQSAYFQSQTFPREYGSAGHLLRWATESAHLRINAKEEKRKSRKTCYLMLPGSLTDATRCSHIISFTLHNNARRGDFIPLILEVRQPDTRTSVFCQSPHREGSESQNLI